MICYHVLNNFLAILEELLGLLALVYKNSKYNSTYLSGKKKRRKGLVALIYFNQNFKKKRNQLKISEDDKKGKKKI